jgi:hypothetical protein
MSIEEAIKVLESHQAWRLGDDDVQMTDPKKLTEANNVILNYLRR